MFAKVKFVGMLGEAASRRFKRKRMRTLLTYSICLSSFAALAYVPLGVNTLSFTTVGPDCYASGEPVLDGECYALVWQKRDTVFPGLPVEPPNPNHPAQNNIWVVEYFPVAKCDDGVSHCPDVIVKGLSLNDENNGSWAVYLLDTRYLNADGTVSCGFDASRTNAPHRINGYTPIGGLTNFNIGTSALLPSGTAGTTYKAGGDLQDFTPTVADQKSVWPASLPVASFSEIRAEGDCVKISVTNTAPFLQYELIEASGPDEFATSGQSVDRSQWGVGSGSLQWSVPVKGKAFFKIQTKECIEFGGGN